MSEAVPTSVELAISRMEGAINLKLADLSAKVDVALTQHGAELRSQGADIAALTTKVEVQGQRAQTYVTWKALGAVITVQLAALWPLINYLTRN